MGAGLNLTMTEQQLPVPTATSLVLEGADPSELADRALAAYLRELPLALLEPDPVARITEVCATLGRQVSVELPDGSVVRGRADRLDAEGRLVVDGVTGSLSAGDVTHVR
jgi:BirA family biotin operon repressor/biotin-[acetyl-CoA-carboxylase] ligase